MFLFQRVPRGLMTNSMVRVVGGAKIPVRVDVAIRRGCCRVRVLCLDLATPSWSPIVHPQWCHITAVR